MFTFSSISMFCQKNPTNSFKFKNCLFRATGIVKNNNKQKYVSSGYRIKFDSAGSCSFDNDTAKTFVIFSVVNSSSFHADNRKNNSLVLDEGPTFGINGNFGSPEKKFSFSFSKAKAKICLGLN